MKRQAEWGGGREIVKRQSGCRGTLSAVTADLGTASQESQISSRGLNRAARKKSRNASDTAAAFASATASAFAAVAASALDAAALVATALDTAALAARDSAALAAAALRRPNWTSVR